MRRKITYVISLLLAFLMGAGVIVYLVYKYPNETVKTVSERNINISENSIADSVDKIKDAVVMVENYYRSNLTGSGTGFVYKTDGEDAYIMTNHHVVERADGIKIIFPDESETEATLVGSDEYADIAILKVKSSKIKGIATLGSSNDLRIGDTVFTIGNPMGKEYYNTVTKGILSGKDRLVSVSVSGYSYDWIMNVMQTDAAINPGNSGGPLCNINGEVIGVNSMKIVQNTVEGIGFAIPIEDALNYANDLIENGSISRPYIGISMIDATSRYQLAYSGLKIDDEITEGVVIAEVESDSPAEKAGLQKADVVINVENHKVSNIAEFRYRLYSHEIGETIKLTVIRSEKTKDLSITLGSK